MNWLHKFSFSVLLISFLVLISACDNNGSTNETKSTSEYKNTSTVKKQYLQTPLHSRQTNTIQGKVPETIIIYTSSISNEIGEFVYSNIEDITLRNTQTIGIENKDSKQKADLYFYEKTISNQSRLLKVTFDNDIFNNTDYYYTNGVKIELINPFASNSPLSKLLIGIKTSDIDLYGFSLVQNIYTPTNPDVEEIRMGDRPFSAYLTIGQIRESYSINRKFSIKSSLNFGVLGPASMGGVVQSSIHDIEPVGWNNQINNSVVIDYAVDLEKSLISNTNFEFNVVTGGHLGTIFNNIYGGIYFRIGRFSPIYRGSSVSNNNLQYWFFMQGKTNFVLYDATLQGSLFGKNDTYTLSSTEINRVVLNASIGFAMYYNSLGLELHSFYLSPEFTNAYDFRWGRINLIFKL